MVSDLAHRKKTVGDPRFVHPKNPAYLYRFVSVHMGGVNFSGFRAHHQPFARHAADNDYLTVFGEGGGLRLFLAERVTLHTVR